MVVQPEQQSKQKHDETQEATGTVVLVASNHLYPSPRKQRIMCSTCERPQPSVCICAGLPDNPLRLLRCKCIVLQHPHERRRKNRSLPLVQLCLQADSMVVSVGRRFGLLPDNNTILRLLRSISAAPSGGDSPIPHMTGPVWLVYPGPDAIPLAQALEQLRHPPDGSAGAIGSTTETTGSTGALTILFLDATWKYVREMDRANLLHRQYPEHMVRVELSLDDTNVTHTRGRFDIRTPPAEQLLSTAEAIALVLATVEDNAAIYETIMRPLDLMVSKWHSYSKKEASV